MIRTSAFYENELDLEELTGLTREELWDHGFNLDDMDGGFTSTTKLHVEKLDRWGCVEFEADLEKQLEMTTIEYALLDYWMSSHCIGWRAAEYNGIYYYTMYHS